MAVKRFETTIVYIIDEDAAVRANQTRLLRNAGIDPRPFASAECFLADARDATRSCVVLDITQAEMGNCPVLALVNKGLIRLPLIVVSADDVSAQARLLGARFFLRKPVDDQALLDAIHWVTGDGRR